ncbi:MAG: ABC transporter permease [Deltaproteobacteria bacterium]|nr:ABC transporter permease [Deltaproteobacteria bacterium]
MALSKIIKLAWRNLWRHKRRTWITVSSIGLGMAFALFLIALGDGVYKKLIDQGIRLEAGHVTLEHPDYEKAPAVDRYVGPLSSISKACRSISGVKRIRPIIRGQAVISTSAGSSGVGVVAGNPEEEKAVSLIPGKIVEGRYIEKGDKRGVVIGKSLAKRLKLKVGKKLVLTTNDVNGELVNELLRVKGIFKTGIEEADGFLVQVPLAVGRRIYKLPDDYVTRIGLILDDPKDQDSVMEAVSAALSGKNVAVLPWQKVLPDLSSYIAVDKGSNIIFQITILFLIGFTILNTILMSVMERQREFATLLAIGTSPLFLKAQVLVESAFIGLLGCVLGLGIGGSLSYYVEKNGLDMSSTFSKGTSVAGFTIDPLIRTDLTMGLMLWLGLGVFLGTMVIGLYPAFKSGKVDIAQTLRMN